MKKGIIVTMPRYDDVTEYLSQFSKEIIKEAKKEGLPYKELIDKEVTKEQFEAIAKSLPYSLVVLNGHGTDKEILGQNSKPIISEGVNDDLLAGRITYARACEAGASLGKSVVKDGESCFIGYELAFQFYADVTWATNPLKDNTARLFLDPSNSVPISLINGKSTIDADKISRRMIIKNLNKVLRNINKESLAVAEALWNNYDGQVVLGNKDTFM